MLNALLIVPALIAVSHTLPTAVAQPQPPTPLRDVQQRIGEVSPQSLKAIVEKLVSFGTRHTLSDTTSETRGIGASRRWIKAHLESFNEPVKAGGDRGKLVVSFEEFTAPKGRRIPRPTSVANIVAILPGTMPESAGRRYYVVGHYDSMPSPTLNLQTNDAGDVKDPTIDAPGANDDGSGTSAVIELARVLAHHPMESTVVFLCTVGEEQGLVGATYHAAQARSRGDDIRAVLNNDIIGDPWGPNGDKSQATPTLIRVFSEGLPRNPDAERLSQIRSLSGESDSPSRELARFIVDVARVEKTAVQPMLVMRQDRFMRGGDHVSFNDSGFAAIRFCEVDEDYRHQHQTPRIEKGPNGEDVQYGDLPEFVDFDYLANVTRLNGAALIHLANAPSSPTKVRIITAKVDVTTHVRWEASPEPDVAGYEVVWRETTSAVWQHAKDVGKALEVTMPVNKDNSFFGVRAYDKDGYRSPVTFAGAAAK